MIRPRRRLPSLTALVAFESAARHRSFTRAAEELCLTQGAVSRQIRSLEQTVGLALFVRVRRAVVLTEPGRHYLAEVRRILEAIEAATERTAAFGAERVLNLAVLPTFATRWLIPRLPLYLENHPQVVVNCLVRLEPFAFAEGLFDGAIHFGDGTWPGARAHHLFREEIVAVASPALLRRRRVVCPRDVLGATLLHQTTRPYAWSDWMAQQGLTSENASQGPRIEQFGMIAEAAIAGLGIALVPRFLVEEELVQARLEILPAKPVESQQAYWFVIPEDKLESEPIGGFLEWLLAEARGLPDSRG